MKQIGQTYQHLFVILLTLLFESLKYFLINTRKERRKEAGCCRMKSTFSGGPSKSPWYVSASCFSLIFVHILPQTTLVLSMYEFPVDSHAVFLPHTSILLFLWGPQHFLLCDADPPIWASWLFLYHLILKIFIHLSQQFVHIHMYVLDRLRTCWGLSLCLYPKFSLKPTGAQGVFVELVDLTSGMLLAISWWVTWSCHGGQCSQAHLGLVEEGYSHMLQV